jgi:hypothetical protein
MIPKRVHHDGMGGISEKFTFSVVFMKKCEKITTKYYQQEILESNVKVLGGAIFDGKHWTFQQNSVPAHKVKMMQPCFTDELSDFITLVYDHLHLPSLIG